MVISNISGQVILGPLLLTPNSIFEETQDLSCNPPAVQEMLEKCLCLPHILSLQLLNIKAILFQLYPNTSLFWRSHKENY